MVHQPPIPRGPLQNAYIRIRGCASISTLWSMCHSPMFVCAWGKYNFQALAFTSIHPSPMPFSSLPMMFPMGTVSHFHCDN